jgi:hypothetical protein
MVILQVLYFIYLLPYLFGSGDDSFALASSPFSSNEEATRHILAMDEAASASKLKQPVITAAHPLVVATRLHLGKATSPPADLRNKLAKFADFCFTTCTQAIDSAQGQHPPHTVANQEGTGATVIATVAVDATPRLADYDLLQAVRTICDEIAAQHGNADWQIRVVPVQPWGRFVPALNALVAFAATELQASRILFVSAETTTVGVSSIARLLRETMPQKGVRGYQDTVLVAGARLTGHDHRVTTGNPSNAKAPHTVALNGRTTPWNTLAVWNLPKLALTGFQLVADGLLSDLAPPPSSPADHQQPQPQQAGSTINMGGVEEVVTIALLQKLLGASNAVAKLIAVPDVTWDESFDDPKRQEWHDQKMASKLSRADQQMKLLGLDGQVEHLSG